VEQSKCCDSWFTICFSAMQNVIRLCRLGPYLSRCDSDGVCVCSDVCLGIVRRAKNRRKDHPFLPFCSLVEECHNLTVRQCAAAHSRALAHSLMGANATIAVEIITLALQDLIDWIEPGMSRSVGIRCFVVCQ
jgi:hypothetical protein